MPASADAAFQVADGILRVFPLGLLAFPPYPQTGASSSLPSSGRFGHQGVPLVICHDRDVVNFWALKWG